MLNSSFFISDATAIQIVLQIFSVSSLSHSFSFFFLQPDDLSPTLCNGAPEKILQRKSG